MGGFVQSDSDATGEKKDMSIPIVTRARRVLIFGTSRHEFEPKAYPRPARGHEKRFAELEERPVAGGTYRNQSVRPA